MSLMPMRRRLRWCPTTEPVSELLLSQGLISREQLLCTRAKGECRVCVCVCVCVCVRVRVRVCVRVCVCMVCIGMYERAAVCKCF